MLKWLGKLVDSNERELKRLHPVVAKINSLEDEFERLSIEELCHKTDEFRERLAGNETLDDLLPEAFAAVREAAKRTLHQRHFDVQLIGGIVLHQGKIAEMKTGEGKTLVATLPLYLNSLTGEGCHLVTVNDYLAKRDPCWMGTIFHALGISVGSIQHEASFLYDPDYESEDQRWTYLRPVPRRQAYEADITYGTNNEFGFDYLRDNMVVDLTQCAQRPLNYAIVDEVDNILIDEARTPLIISGTSDESSQKYEVCARLVSRLVKDEDYAVDEKMRSVSLTDDGITRVERMLQSQGLLHAPALYDSSNYTLTYYIESALKAYVLFKKNRDYVVNDGQVIIVDEFTGRLMPGRRYSEGLHQAIEAKERVKVRAESITLATITFQNYFRLYKKLAGMTGTAVTEAEEFHKIYHLDVAVIPTNKPMIRHNYPDRVYKTEQAKFRAVVEEIASLHVEEHPVLVGTTSVEKSEQLSELLKCKGIPHHVLNAKYHEKEAYIIAQAGQPGAVTVATSMAGRGVDIALGPGVVENGGLHIIGTEHYESRRIDNQLGGRAGRQGDPGSSRFYASLEDDLTRQFGGDKLKGIMNWAKIDDSVPIELSVVGKAIASSQSKVEAYHFDIRKHLVDYDDVISKHREIIYAERRKILEGADLKANIHSTVEEEIGVLVDDCVTEDRVDTKRLLEGISQIFPLPPGITPQLLSMLSEDEIEDRLVKCAESVYVEQEEKIGSENMRKLERLVMLRVIDKLWIEHLTMMDQMRQGIGLRAVAQTDPLVAYKREGYTLFESLLASIQHDVAHTIYHVDIVKKEPKLAVQAAQTEALRGKGGKKVGRNYPCPCGSGKKYKNCCGRGE